MKRILFIGLMFLLGCDIFNQQDKICVEYNVVTLGLYAYHCFTWEDSESACTINDNYYYEDMTCEEFCEEREDYHESNGQGVICNED